MCQSLIMRIAERVVLVVVLEDRLGERSPSGRPRRLARLPAMMFRTTTSIFTISQARTSMSRSERRRTKCVGDALLARGSRKSTSDMRLLRMPLLDDRAALLRVERGGVVLEVLDQQVRVGACDRPAWPCPRREAHAAPSPSSRARAKRASICRR